MTAIGGLLAVIALVLAGTAGFDGARATAGPAPRGNRLVASPIRHVVIVYQENHTFDDVLGAVCHARATPCNGYVGPVTMADGTTAQDVVQPDVIPIIRHDPASQGLGLANRWDAISGCTDAPYLCVSHVDPARIPNLASLADAFTVSDATFAAGKAASFGAHLNLELGTQDGFLGDDPVTSKVGHRPGPGWGCRSFRDALWGTATQHRYVPSCIPDKAGNGPYRTSPVPYRPTIMERMEARGLSWHIYQGDKASAPEDNVYSLCTYSAWCLRNRFNLGYDSATSDFITAARKATLPNLSVLIPSDGNAQHNGNSMTVGDTYIGRVVQAVEDSPEWDSTAVFITYDDCGCFYDHVAPPDSLGLRNPMVIVSPWARPQFTDSTTAVQPYSMLAFVQHTFGLTPLSSQVSQAYDYAGSFAFGQRPLAGVPMTATSISAAERARIARLAPLIADDPT